jgi:hypothetical protein
MEPIVIAGLGIVIYCGWLALVDCIPAGRRPNVSFRKAKVYHLNSRRGRPVSGQADAVAEHWQERRAGSF